MLALGLTVFGFYFVFADDSASKVEDVAMPEPFLVPLEELPLEPLTEPVELSYRWPDRAYRLDLRQVTRADGALSRTWIDTQVREKAMEPPGRVLQTFGDMTVRIAGEDGPVGPEVTREVERLLAIAAYEIDREPTGETVRHELRSSEAAQARQTLSLLRGAIALGHPRVPREEVRQGETWSWEVPVTFSPREDNPSHIDGKTSLEARVAGRDGSNIVVEMTGEFEASGEVSGEEGLTEFAADGTVQGRGVFDAATGQLVESTLRVETRTDDFERELLVRLRNE